MAVAPRQRLSEVNPNGAMYFMEKLIGKIYQHFDDDFLTDVTFKFTNPTALITAHRLMLSSASEYFRALFGSDEGICPVIEINDIDADTFERLITFCYTGKVLITTENMEQMLNAAVILKLDDAVAECMDFILDHISDLTLERLYSLESETQCEIIKSKVLEYNIKNFMEITQSEEFLNFDANNLQKIIEHDDLNIQCEEDAFKAIKHWYEHDPQAREQHLPDLISCLRLTQIDPDFLLDHIQPLPGCENIVLKTLSWAHCPAGRVKLSLRFLNPRALQLEGTAFSALNIGNTHKGTILEYKIAENSWHKCFDINIDICDFKAIFMDNNLFFIGGIRNGRQVSEVRSWSFKTKTLIQLPSMKGARSAHCVVSLNNKIYVIGGHGGPEKDNVLRSVESYSESSGWTSVNSMIKDREWAGAVTLNEKIYVMGGSNTKLYLGAVECYDPKTNFWTQCADMNEGRHKFGVAVHKGEILVVGGKAREIRKSVERYNPQLNEWTMICSLKYGIEDIFATSIDKQLWTVGGSESRNVSVYDEDSDQWSDKENIPLNGPYYCFTAPRSLLKNDL